MSVVSWISYTQFRKLVIYLQHFREAIHTNISSFTLSKKTKYITYDNFVYSHIRQVFQTAISYTKTYKLVGRYSVLKLLFSWQDKLVSTCDAYEMVRKKQSFPPFFKYKWSVHLEVRIQVTNNVQVLSFLQIEHFIKYKWN